MSWYKSGKLWCFVGGVAAAAVGTTLAKSEKVRELTVAGVAKGMEIQECAQEAIQDIKDKAEDVCADARAKAKADALHQEKMIKIEERVRKLVEEEMAAEEEKSAHEAKSAKEADKS